MIVTEEWRCQQVPGMKNATALMWFSMPGIWKYLMKMQPNMFIPFMHPKLFHATGWWTNQHANMPKHGKKLPHNCSSHKAPYVSVSTSTPYQMLVPLCLKIINSFREAASGVSLNSLSYSSDYSVNLVPDCVGETSQHILWACWIGYHSMRKLWSDDTYWLC